MTLEEGNDKKVMFILKIEVSQVFFEKTIFKNKVFKINFYKKILKTNGKTNGSEEMGESRE